MPLASIGIPVYNGDKYLRDAIDSVLNQSYSAFELIIFDNASTDNTRDICSEYAMADDRVKYFRNETNLGAGPNYDKCFYKASGRYFKWLAHDDMLDKDYLAKTVYALEDDADAVLCFTDIRKIDENSNETGISKLNYPGIFSSNPSDRFFSMLNFLRENECFFSLFRREVLEGSELHGNYMNSDLVLIAEVALRGNFIKVEEPLFYHRLHDNRYTKAVYPDRAAASTWFDTSNDPGKSYRAITLYRKYIEIIRKNLPEKDARITCYRHLLKYVLSKRNLKILFFDLVYLVSPWIYKNTGIIRSADINTK